MRRLLTVASLAVAAACFPDIAFGCSCVPSELPCGTLPADVAVFVGTVRAKSDGAPVEQVPAPSGQLSPGINAAPAPSLSLSLSTYDSSSRSARYLPVLPDLRSR